MQSERVEHKRSVERSSALLSWITTILCLIGSALNAKKIVLCFYFWTAGNVIWLYIDLLNHNYSRATLDIVQGIITLWGLWEWKNEIVNDTKRHINKRGKHHEF